ncbi:NAD(P)-dependent oxidoreductase [Paenibacillus arenilitoris]|uniref:NAD(P)H-binding protein n=1 Tax=Paenibacillus arenilitoris TaxID=2772299 RepID=A0A927HA15_9BACL|nr:NAD(P)H-binding protein [Paenibacillus arenilitoris]MBD2872179.1 NAD(P)H-binding protein [Paenibacillus arenilitoris]
MKLLIIGATGRVGRQVRTIAEQRGVNVRLFVRSGDGRHPDLAEGDVRNKRDVLAAMTGASGVISCLSTEDGGTLIEGTRNIAEAMRERGTTRLVTIGTAGILESSAEPGLLRYRSSENRRTTTAAAAEHHQAYEYLKESGLEWTIVCPTRLVEGERTGVYRTLADKLPFGGTTISFADTAEFALNEYFSRQFVHARAGIAY